MSSSMLVIINYSSFKKENHWFEIEPISDDVNNIIYFMFILSFWYKLAQIFSLSQIFMTNYSFSSLYCTSSHDWHIRLSVFFFTSNNILFIFCIKFFCLLHKRTKFICAENRIACLYAIFIEIYETILTKAKNWIIFKKKMSVSKQKKSMLEKNPMLCTSSNLIFHMCNLQRMIMQFFYHFAR